MEIDLGKKNECCPCPTTSPVSDSAPEVYYPSLYIDGGAELKELPESGTLTVKFRRRGFRETDTKKGKQYSLELEVMAVVDASGPKAAKRKSRESELDELAAEVSKRLEE